MKKTLKKEEVKEIQNALETSDNPLFFYDDDTDGLCSYLLMKRYIERGNGVILRGSPSLDTDWIRQVNKFSPDKIFALDIAQVEQDFIDSISKPKYWIDHHGIEKRRNINYYNPRLENPESYIPTSKLAYDIVEQDQWISLIGCIADWHVPNYIDEFKNKYPDLIDKKPSDPGELFFDTKIGKLIRIFSFILKGETSEILESVRKLSKITSPYELLKGETPKSRYLLKKFRKVDSEYKKLEKKAVEHETNSKILDFKYKAKNWSFSARLSNKLSYYNPEKIVLVCRKSDNRYKCSIRSKEKPISNSLKKAIKNIDAKGGGHSHACGASVSIKDYEKFITTLKEEYEKAPLKKIE